MQYKRQCLWPEINFLTSIIIICKNIYTLCATPVFNHETKAQQFLSVLVEVKNYSVCILGIKQQSWRLTNLAPELQSISRCMQVVSIALALQCISQYNMMNIFSMYVCPLWSIFLAQRAI